MSKELDPNKIAALTITELAKSVASGIYTHIKNTYEDSEAKFSIDTGEAFEKYINKAKERCEKIKTLLYRHDARNLYSFYECVGVSRNDTVIETTSVNNIIEIGNKVIITGTGGIGKTIMMKHFFLSCIREAVYIPALVELRGLNETAPNELSISDFIYETLQKSGFELERTYFDYSMEAGSYLILFDGYDEVRGDIANIVSKEIRDIANKYPSNSYIMSSRPFDEFIGWNDFVELEALPMTKDQALSLINRLEYDETTKTKFYQALDKELFEKYETFASNPLLLTIMLMTFESNGTLPDKLNDFYEQAFSVLFNKHDATKEKFKRDLKSGLGYEDFRKIFSYICFRSFFKSQYEFTTSQIIDLIERAKEKLQGINKDFRSEDYLSDLTDSVCMLVKEGLNYKFSHRSFQEYFAAWYTTLLSDKDQTKVIISWLKEIGYNASSYLNMLHDLQSSRTIENVVISTIGELKNKYEKHGYTKGNIMKDLCSHIEILKDEDSYHIFVVWKYSHRFIFEIVRFLLSLSAHFIFSNFENRQTVHRNIGEKHGGGLISPDQLEESDLIALADVEGFSEAFDISFRFIEKYEAETKKLGNKRKLDSILDEL